MAKWPAVTIGALLLSACVLPPKEAAHVKKMPADQLGLSGAAIEPISEGWWASFEDPQLDRLIRLGLKDSPTLAQAQARVGEAASEEQAARSKLLPKADLGANVQYQRAPSTYLVPAPFAGHSYWFGQAGANLSWQLDFWGRQAQAVRSAHDLSESAQLDVESAKLMLAGAITQAYLELYRQRQLAAIAQRSEAQRQRIVDITRHRVAAGLDTQLELREAEGQLPQARVAREQAEAAAQVAVHQLATLTAQGAGAYSLNVPPSLKIDAALPIPTTLPINLLARRPDVISARALVEAADAHRLSAKAAFYPDVSLSALAGFGAFGLHNLVQWSSHGAAGGPLVSLPLFDGGLLRAEYRGAEAQLDAAVASYNGTVLQAVQQAADQLTGLDALERERLDQQQTLTATEAAYKLAEERYRAGLASYLTVLNAETQVLIARQSMTDIVTAQAAARVTLLLDVGGSFDARAFGALVADRQPNSPATP
jgi:NodT family efflux transporter outer membrane factor (OMF) lipoprotein